MTYTCHNTEWFDTDTCLMCEAATTERERILSLLQTESRTWGKPVSFNYRARLLALIDKITETVSTPEKPAKPTFTLDEYDGELIAGVRYANTFTYNLARLSRDNGAATEQERIIKLLEDNETLGYGYLVALIKGENK